MHISFLHLKVANQRLHFCCLRCSIKVKYRIRDTFPRDFSKIFPSLRGSRDISFHRPHREPHNIPSIRRNLVVPISFQVSTSLHTVYGDSVSRGLPVCCPTFSWYLRLPMTEDGPAEFAWVAGNTPSWFTCPLTVAYPSAGLVTGLQVDT